MALMTDHPTDAAADRTSAGGAPEPTWAAVDSYVVAQLTATDDVLEAVHHDSVAAGLPDIAVSPTQGKLLHLLTRAVGARRVLEVGTLGGYSTVWFARALTPGGRVVTLEIDPHHAEVARSNVAAAGLADLVEVRVGPALDTLAQLAAEGAAPFDLVFVDADKENNAAYVRLALALSRPGTVVVVDNVVRQGHVVDADSTDSRVQGTRALFDYLATEPRLDGTALQTVGAKGYDGFVLALVTS
jgi:predicted O-methyltransferase YrrM